MANKKIRLTKQETFSENPFLEKAIQQITENTKTKYRWLKGKNAAQREYVETKTGEIIAHSTFLQHIEVDETQFAKLYLSQLGVFFDLPKTALRVFTYFLNGLPTKADRMYINIKEALKFTGYKNENSIQAGLAILCDKGFLARSEMHYMYFINPLIFFNGDRMTFATSYVKKRNKLIKEDPNQLKISFSEIGDAFENETSENTSV